MECNVSKTQELPQITVQPPVVLIPNSPVSPSPTEKPRKRVRRSPNISALEANKSVDSLQDVSNVSGKTTGPIRTSGRIRVKMAQHFEEPDEEEEVLIKPTPVKPLAVASKAKRRRPKKMSKEQTKDCLDVKRPSSVLVDTSIRALLTNLAFSRLSPANQTLLIDALPAVDRPTASTGLNLNPSSINNEFFNRACIEWRDRLAYGEFTNEHQTRLKAEVEKDKTKIDPWKRKNFENIWGIKLASGSGSGGSDCGFQTMLQQSAVEIKTKMDSGVENFDIPMTFISDVKSESPGREQRVGAITRAAANIMGPPTVTAPIVEPIKMEEVVDDVVKLDEDTEMEVKTPEEPDFPEMDDDRLETETPEVKEMVDQETLPDFIPDDAGYQPSISHIVPVKWYQNEHDYLKNDGMEMVQEPPRQLLANDDPDDDREQMIEEPMSPAPSNYHNILSQVESGNMLINSYGTHLKVASEDDPSIIIDSGSQQELQHVNYGSGSGIILQDDREYINCTDAFLLEDINEEEVRVSVPTKNLKLVAFPGVNYNDKYIIEEHPSHVQPMTQNSYFVGSNFTYSVKMDNKLDVQDQQLQHQKIFKQESNNNQNCVKQRIIYEIASEPHYEQPTVTYNTNSDTFQPVMKTCQNGQVYEQPAGVSTKKTLQQRVPELQNLLTMGGKVNNTIILTPAQTTKNVVHIRHHHQQNNLPVQFLQQQLIKKNTVFMAPLPQKFHTTVIRAPATITAPAPKPIQKQKVIMSTSSLQQYRHYRSPHPNRQSHPQPMSSQMVPTVTVATPVVVPTHQSRKQLHPQQIIRPQRQTLPATSTVIHQGHHNINVQVQQVNPRQHQHVQIHQHQVMTVTMPSPTQTVTASNFLNTQQQQQQQQHNRSTVVATVKQEWNYQAQSTQQQVTQQVVQQPQQNLLIKTIQQQQQMQQQLQHTQQLQQQLVQQQQQQQINLHPRSGARAPTNQRPPPGTVNLERSYQICQAVIQNSPNRHQLNCQLKPRPTSLLAPHHCANVKKF